MPSPHSTNLPSRASSGAEADLVERAFERARQSPRRRHLAFAAGNSERLTHYLFRYPAKFHPPVVRQLITDLTGDGELLYDPFCGSGTLLVEARVAGRHALGSDVDPLAVFISAVKSRPLAERRLRRDLGALMPALVAHRRSAAEYERLQFDDIARDECASQLDSLWAPAIPNIEHWFRRYVIVDLARIFCAIHQAPIPETSRRFFWLVFASIVRAASNADPVPVSGLEVTSHMKRIDAAGRVIDPFALWERAAEKAIRDMGAFHTAAAPGIRASAVTADATCLPASVKRREVAAIITSPPYHGAVDYYRRHQLEMFWLRLVWDQQQRLRLLQRYIGRTKVAARHPLVRAKVGLPAPEAVVEQQMREVDASRADAFRHYCVAMGRVFGQLARVLKASSPAVLVVGHSIWRGTALNTSDLFAELAGPYFRLEEVLDYPVKNRYMSYARHNGASIDHEYVLVLRRTKTAAT